MDLREIRNFLGEDWKSVERQIETSLKSDIDLLDTTNKMILSHSGKQLRPILSLLAARACSGGSVTEAACRYAAAAELLHNATLLHDDVADNSMKRRGNPTILSLMGASASVLVGDYWLVKAMRQIIGEDSMSYRATMIFSKTLCDLAEGEMLQLQKASQCDTTEEDCLRIIYSKTASLFEAAAVSGAVAVNAPAEYEKAVGDYAVALGIAFQIKDDIFDYSQSEQVGKPVGVDVTEQKITIPLIGAMKGSPREEEIRDKVRNIAAHPEYRDDVMAFVVENGGLAYAYKRLNDFADKAVSALSVLPESREKTLLAELVRYIGERNR